MDDFERVCNIHSALITMAKEINGVLAMDGHTAQETARFDSIKRNIVSALSAIMEDMPVEE